MLSLAWRQHRTALLLFAAALIGAVAFVGVWESALASMVPASCTAFMDPPNAPPEIVRLQNLTTCERASFEFVWAWGGVSGFGDFLLFVLPLALGMFVGAPLVASEYRRGTLSMVWTQGVTRRRWFLTKIGLPIAVSAIGLATLGVILVFWLSKSHAFICCDPPPWDAFDVTGIVPAAYASFAIALGALAGVLLKRTLPAMGVTAVGFLVVRYTFLVFRALLALLMSPVQVESLDGQIPSNGLPAGPAHFIDSTGNQMSVDAMHRIFAADPNTPSPAGTMAYLHAHGYRMIFSIQPEARFWPFQAIEATVFVVLAALLTGVALWILSTRFE